MFVFYNLQKHYLKKATYFSNICLQNPTISGDWACQDLKIFVFDMLLYRLRRSAFTVRINPYPANVENRVSS